MPKRVLEREPSTGNVFADLGLPDASEHLIKAGLVLRIDRTIRQRRLTQTAAAELMGIDQPKISAMLSGQFRGYSVERLMRFLVALGHDVEIVVKPRKRGAAELLLGRFLYRGQAVDLRDLLRRLQGALRLGTRKLNWSADAGETEPSAPARLQGFPERSVPGPRQIRIGFHQGEGFFTSLAEDLLIPR